MPPGDGGSSAFKVVGEAGDGRTAIDGISATHPAVVLLVLSGFPASRMAQAAEESGADGCVEKGTPIAKLRSVARQAVADRAAA